MANPRPSARRAAATRLGITPAEYQAHIDAGRKWCTACREWLPREKFAPNPATHDGLAQLCSRPHIRAHHNPDAGRCPVCGTPTRNNILRPDGSRCPAHARTTEQRAAETQAALRWVSGRMNDSAWPGDIS